MLYSLRWNSHNIELTIFYFILLFRIIHFIISLKFLYIYLFQRDTGSLGGGAE